ncbi:uncharacterized protein LOC133528754 [Cydia pomonella]|uniref:uncharacterized protein LOC133528754 n=1 Tax=Cydia pomonella TaxID=82600 RepID=UPI002ADE7C6E|nr:uncharacterized protein LOC133528754 [Cydia pomonella]
MVKQQKRKTIEKIPCAISVQTLSIPMKYADTHSTSTQNRIDSHNKTKSSNPPKQVGEKRLCQTIGGKETENKLLVQISEAEQVSDFERILNSNAILCERRGHVWRSVAAPTPASAHRPRSSYSLRAVSQAYHYLFRQHEDSLQPLIDHYRQTLAADNESLGNNLDNLNDLQEFYEDDHTLKKEIETATDQFITEEIQEEPRGKRGNFNVNLAGLIDLHVTGEACSPVPHEIDPLPDVDRGTDDEEEWLALSMSASDDQQENRDSVDCLAQNLNSVKLSDAKVPTITFSNCSDGDRSELPNNKDVVIHLAVPSIDCIDETRPPM